MSQASTTTATTTTPLVTVMCSGTSSFLSTVTMAPSLMGLSVTPAQHDVFMSPSLTPRNSGGVVSLATLPQHQPQSQMPLQAHANYAMGRPQVGFSFRVEIPTSLFLYAWCLFWCMLSAFRCHAGCHIHLWGLNHLGLHHCNPLEITHGRHMCSLAVVIDPHQVCCCLYCFESGYSAVPQPVQLYGGAYSFGGLAESHQIPPPSLYGGEGLLFQVWLHPMTQSTLNLQWALNLVILVW